MDDLTPPEKTRPCAPAESPLRWAGSARSSYMSPLSTPSSRIKSHDDRFTPSPLLAGYDLTTPEKTRSCAADRSPFREASGPRPYMPPLSTLSSRTKSHGDRFIPYRGSETDMDISRYFLTEPRKSAATTTTLQSPSSQVYQRLLAEKLLNNRTRILNFGNKPREPDTTFRADAAYIQAKPKCRTRIISQTPERMLAAPDLVDDYCLNLLDWGSSNMLCIALGNTIYVLDTSNGSTSELTTVHEDDGPVSSVSWAPDGRHIAVGLSSSVVQLWDIPALTNWLVRTLEGVHQSRVGSLAWRNRKVLTSGGMDGKIVNNDLRIRSRAVAQTYRGHAQEVCALKWSGSGQLLASGGNDNLLHLWDASMASSSAGRCTRWLYRLEDHSAAVKGLAWCPFQSNLLASGGGTDDRCIKFWNASTGGCLNSVDTGSQVSALLWNKNNRELLSSHGFAHNQLTLWKYPSMVKMAELGDTCRVLFMAQSPDCCTVASAAADETLRFWNVFGSPDAPPKAAVKTRHTGMFSSYNHIR